MLFAAKADLLRIPTDAHISLSAVKVGPSMQEPASAPITFRLTLWVVSHSCISQAPYEGGWRRQDFSPACLTKIHPSEIKSLEMEAGI